jgi:DNA-binding MarR family transcriptional regulator
VFLVCQVGPRHVRRTARATSAARPAPRPPHGPRHVRRTAGHRPVPPDIFSSVNELNRTGLPAEAPGNAAAELVGAISAVRRTLRRAVRNSWHEQPLPPTQSELLRLAAVQPGITVAEAAQELRLASNTVSTLVGRLSAQGLIERGRSSSDGRAIRLTVTGKARDRISEWRDLRAELAGRAISGLSDGDKRSLAAAVPALERLAEQLEKAQP